MTAQVKTDGAGWKKFEGNEAAGVCATQFAPAITTYDGRTVNLMENYETTAETTGQIIYQNISGLDNGKYKVGFYANAFFTSGRGFESDMADGAEDVAYVFANEKKEFITAKIATATTENNFRQFEVEVTDGNIKLGLGKEKPGTNWHTIQIYQLTWSTTAQAAYAKDKATMEALINQAAALENDPEKENGKAELGAAIYAAQAAMKSNRLNIPEFEAEIGKLQTAIEDFDAANRITFSGVYYVQSVANGKYLSAGHSWGTQAIVDADGLDLTLAVVPGHQRERRTRSGRRGCCLAVRQRRGALCRTGRGHEGQWRRRNIPDQGCQLWPQQPAPKRMDRERGLHQQEPERWQQHQQLRRVVPLGVHHQPAR